MREKKRGHQDWTIRDTGNIGTQDTLMQRQTHNTTQHKKLNRWATKTHKIRGLTLVLAKGTLFLFISEDVFRFSCTRMGLFTTHAFFVWICNLVVWCCVGHNYGGICKITSPIFYFLVDNSAFWKYNFINQTTLKWQRHAAVAFKDRSKEHGSTILLEDVSRSF